MFDEKQVLLEVEKYCKHAGHDINHILRVYNLAISFGENEDVNLEIVKLAALLHDVDDYKFNDTNDSVMLKNTNYILNNLNVDVDIKEKVLLIIETMGYKNRLKGIYPQTLEGKIVSDADMCDAIGSNGIIRTIEYGISKGNVFFDHSIFPKLDHTSESYQKSSAPIVNHFFEKLLKLKYLMLTNSGKKEAILRHEVMVVFLESFFNEKNDLNWKKYLKDYLKNLEE